MRFAVRMIRHAISPRLAINSFWKRRASDTITSFFSHTLIFLAFFVLPTVYLRQYAGSPAYFPRLIRRCSPVEGIAYGLMWSTNLTQFIEFIFRL